MAIRFRKSKKVIPGVKMSVSKGSVSMRVGPQGLGISANTKGQIRGSAGIPGTGIYATKVLNNKKKDIASTDRPTVSTERAFVSFYDLVDLTAKEQEAFEVFVRSVILEDGTVDDEKWLTVKDINEKGYEFSTQVFNSLYNKAFLEKDRVNKENVYSLNTTKILNLKAQYENWYEAKIAKKKLEMDNKIFGKKKIQDEIDVLLRLQKAFGASILHQI